MAKSFKDKANNGSVYASIIGTQEEYKADEVQEAQVDFTERQEALRTQGKKGAKAQRFNMAFTPSNLDFIRVMSKIKGLTMTQFVNEIINREREAQSDTYEKAKSLIENL